MTLVECFACSNHIAYRTYNSPIMMLVTALVALACFSCSTDVPIAPPDASMSSDNDAIGDPSNGEDPDTGSLENAQNAEPDTGSDDPDTNDSNDNGSECESQDSSTCSGGDIHWVDSCGNLGDVRESCEYGCDSEGCLPCQPDCSSVECGPDPVCGDGCGDCAGVNSCSSGSCVESSNWAIAEINGEEILATSGITYNQYDVSQDTASAYLATDSNYYIASIVIDDVSSQDQLNYQCGDWSGSGDSLSIFANTSEFPLNWKDEVFSPYICDANPDEGEDYATTWDFNVTSVTSSELVGSFDVEIQGAGPREGDTLTVYGEFDTELDEM